VGWHEGGADLSEMGWTRASGCGRGWGRGVLHAGGIIHGAHVCAAPVPHTSWCRAHELDGPAAEGLEGGRGGEGYTRPVGQTSRAQNAEPRS
jgi:hypothetical protein